MDCPAVGSYEFDNGYFATLRPVTRSEAARGKFGSYGHVVTLWQRRPHHAARKVAWDVTTSDRWTRDARRLYATAV